MTLKLSLPPGVESRLKAAASRNGQPADQYAVQLLDQHLPPAESNGAAAQMLLRWAEEADALTDAESAENEQILRAIDAHRLSDRKLFTHLLRGKNR
ncbi:MAG TPA: hypothetical protein VKE40_25315 [Gemmataceae bacterium]|nr:hypothetical protein [Gemmataceae bacterium]